MNTETTKGIHPKVAAATVTGAACTLISWVLAQFFHITVPQEVSAAVTTALSLVAGYVAPNGA